MEELEKLNTLFEANKKWKRDFPTTAGNENPFPLKIEKEFLKYYFKHYKATLSYATKKKRVGYVVTKSEIEDSISHAVFDCDNLESCFNTLEYWIRDYKEGYIEDEEIELVEEIEVKSIKK